MSSSSLSGWISEKAYLVAQSFAILLINQYAKVHGEEFRIESDSPGRYRYYGQSAVRDEVAPLEGMLQLGVPWLWLAPAWWGSILAFSASAPSLQHFFGSAMFAIGVLGWYLASRFTSNTSVEYAPVPQ